MRKLYKWCITTVLILFCIAICSNRLYAQKQNTHSSVVASAPFEEQHLYQHSIKIDSVVAQKAGNVTDLIRGSLSGVNVITTEGAPGASIDILIRGLSGVRGNLQPLIILDGVMLNPTHQDIRNPWSSIDGVDYQPIQNMLFGINNQDIKSITILKDASSTASYGSLGANGVILITTKVGNMGERVITLSSNVTVATPSKKIDYLSPQEYKRYYKALTGENFNSSGRREVDWQDELLAPAISHNHNLSLSGTMAQTSYYISLNARFLKGIVKGTDANDLALRVNIDQKVSKNTRMGVRFIFDRNTTLMNQSSSWLGGSSLVTRLSAAPFTNTGENPENWKSDYYDNSVSWRVIPQAYMNIKLLDNLTFDIVGGVDFISKERLRWMGSSIDRGAADGGRAGRGQMNNILYNMRSYLTWSQQLKKVHSYKISAGIDYNGSKNVTSLIKGYNYPVDALKADGITLGDGIVGRDDKPVYAKTQSSNFNLFASAGYTYNNKYTIQGGIHADKRDKYDDSFYYYPFAQAQWSLANECLWQQWIPASVISKFDLYAGWGRSGRDEIRPYTQIDEFTIGRSTAWVPYMAQIFYNGRLQAELQEWNVGLNTAFANGKIDLRVELYKGTSRDILTIYNFSGPKYITEEIENDNGEVASVKKPIYASKHFWRNTIAMQRKGIDIDLSAQLLQRGGFSWDVAGNISFCRLNITDAGVDASSVLGATNGVGFQGRSLGVIDAREVNATAFINNQAPGLFYGYQTKGILHPQHEATTPPLLGHRLYAGDLKFIDQNLDGQVDAYDKVVLGNPNPKFTAGFSTGFRYNRWAMRLFFDASYGNDILNLNLLTQSNSSQTGNIRREYLTQAWSPEKPLNVYPRIGGYGMYEVTDRMVEDGSFLRLSNLTLDYNIPVGRSKWLSSLNVSFIASNLFVITRYSGYDPDVNSFAGDWSLRGIDLGAYPRARSFSIGLKAVF